MSKTHNVADVVAQFTYMRAEKGFLVKTPGLKANGEGGDKRVTRDSLNNMPFAPFKAFMGRQLNSDFGQA